MIKRIVLTGIVLIGLVSLASFRPKPVMAQAGAQAIVAATLDNSSPAASIPITVTVHYYNSFGELLNGASPRTYTVPVGTVYWLYSGLDNTNSPPYSVTWGTSCSDPRTAAGYFGTWGVGGVADYQTDPQDVHCTTPNATPYITNTACNSVGWGLTGIGVDGTNIASFSVYESQNSGDVGPGDPVPSSLVASGLSPGTRSYNFSLPDSASPYYVRIRAVSPQGVGSWSSIGQFTCAPGVVITPAVNLSANPYCASQTADTTANVVGVNYGWTPSSPAGNPQYLDFSIWPNNFAPGTFSNYPVTGASSLNAPPPGYPMYPQGVTFYWRVNNYISGNWYPSVTGRFTTPTCPPNAILPIATPVATPQVGKPCPAGCTAPTKTYSYARPSAWWHMWTDGTGPCGARDIAGFTAALDSGNQLFCAGEYIYWEVKPADGSGNTFVAIRSWVSDGGTIYTSTGVVKLNWTWQYEVQLHLTGYSYGSAGSQSDNRKVTSTSNDPFCNDGSISCDSKTPFANLNSGASYDITFCTPACQVGVYSTASSFTSGSCTACPTQGPTPSPEPVVITLSGFSDCVDALHPKVHLRWTSNSGGTAYSILRDGTAVMGSGTNVTSTGIPSSLGGTDRSWDVTMTDPGVSHNWKVHSSGGTFDPNESNLYPITTATCTPPPANPTNLNVTTACTGGTPTMSFSWQNNATTETGFWLDVSHDAFTGDSSTVASLAGQTSQWAVKAVSYSDHTPPKTVNFTWSATSALDFGDAYTGKDVTSINVTNGGTGYTSAPAVIISGGGGVGAQAVASISAGKVTSIAITYGGKNYTSAPSISFSGGGGGGAVASATVSTIGDTPLVPAKGVTYYWRVTAYSLTQQSAKIYPTSTTTPPGISFTTPTCMFDLKVANSPLGNQQVYDPGATANLTVRVFNTSQAEVDFTGPGSVGFWPTSTTLPNCSASPPVPQTPSASKAITVTPLLRNTDDLNPTSYQDFTFSFTVSNTPGSYVANFYVLPNCSPNNDKNWSNNSFQLLYVVAAKTWFNTVGGDVGGRGKIQVSNTSVPVNSQSTAVLAGNPLDSSVSGRWELNNYSKALFPADGGGVYNYFASRFRYKATNPSSCTVNPVQVAVWASNSWSYVQCTSNADVGGLNISTAGNWVVFVDGNLTVSSNFGFATGSNSTIVFVVKGDVTFNTNVTQADGVYIAGGTVHDYDNTNGKGRKWASPTGNYYLTVNGGIYAKAFDLGSFLTDDPLCGDACKNSLNPSDYVVFQAKYLVPAVAQLIGSPAVSWQEVAP